MKRFFLKIGKAEIRNALAIIWILATLIFVFVLVFHVVPMENNSLLNIFGGAMLTGSGTIISYYFGSSKNEADANKNDVTNIETKTSNV
jgi:hypothetical protein